MSKLTFKRLALALVAALSLGVLSNASSSASQDEVVTLTASATTVELNESITVTVDMSFISDSASESLNARVVKTGGAAFTATTLIPLAADSANVGGLGSLVSGAFGYTEINAATTADQFTATTSGTYTRAKWTLRLSKASTAGTATYTVSLRSGGDGAGADTVEKAASFTVTVTAADTTGTAGKTLLFLNDTVPATGGTGGAGSAPTGTHGFTYTRSDSSIVAGMGTATSTTNGSQIVGLIYAEPRNAADTRTATSGSAVDATVNLVVSGAGLLANASAPTTVGKSINVARGETVNVIADGTAGTMTITGYIGGVALTQAAKTITFVGYADTFIPTVESSTIITGSTGTGAITFVVKDSAGSALGSSLVQTRPNGYPSATSGYWLVVADTKVVGGTAVNAVSSTAAYTQCAYNATRAKYVCNVPVVDSGTATVYIADSLTVGTALKTSQALTITVAGPAYKGTVKFDKTSYNVGEAATLTLTSKDYGDRDAINGTTSPFSGLYWVGQALSTTAFTKNGSSNASGGTFTDIAGYIDGSGTDKATYVNGVDTALVYMPTTAGTFTLFGKTAGAATASQILTFTVTDPVQDAQTAAIAAAQKAAVAQAAAAQAAADAATDAALQAIDAANAATDAANLAAEAADAATVAAQEAKDAADAATAAVESLATQVATLMAALQAQITSLANVVAKIAKKVKA